VISLQTTDPFSRQRRRLRKKVFVRRRKKSKIKSGQGSQREVRYPDELVDWLSAARRTTPTTSSGIGWLTIGDRWFPQKTTVKATIDKLLEAEFSIASTPRLYIEE
jgi:hypothetical protein